MKIDISKAVKAGFNFLKIPEEGIKKNDVYTYSFVDYDIVKAGIISIEYSVSAVMLNEFIKEKRISLRNITYIRASSSLKDKYQPAMAVDGKFNTVWVEGKDDDGTSEWIEIGLKNFSLSAVGIANGLLTTKKLYLANNRIKRCKLDITRNDGIKVTHEYTLEDLSYPEENLTNGRVFTRLFDRGDDPDPEFNLMVNSVRITILETYKGNKYNDTCISEIFLLGHKTK